MADKEYDVLGDLKALLDSALKSDSNGINMKNKVTFDVSGTKELSNAVKLWNELIKVQKDYNKLKRYKSVNPQDALDKINSVNIKTNPGDLVSFVNAYKAQFNDWDNITEDVYKGITRIKEAYERLSKETNADGQLKYVKNSIDNFKDLFLKYSELEHLGFSVKYDLNFDDEDVIEQFQNRKQALIDKINSLDKGKKQTIFGEEEIILGDPKSEIKIIEYFSELEKIIDMYGGEIPERIRELYSAITKEIVSDDKNIQKAAESASERGFSSFNRFIKDLKKNGFSNNVDLDNTVLDKYSKKIDELGDKADKVFDNITSLYSKTIKKSGEDENYYISKIDELTAYLDTIENLREELNRIQTSGVVGEDFVKIDNLLSYLEDAEKLANEKIGEIREQYSQIDFEAERAKKEAEQRKKDLKREFEQKAYREYDGTNFDEFLEMLQMYKNRIEDGFEDIDSLYEDFNRSWQEKMSEGMGGAGGSGNGSDNFGFDDFEDDVNDSIGDVEKLVEALEKLTEEVRQIREAVGTIDEESGVKNLISQFDTLIQKISELQEVVSRINFNVVINDPNKDDDFWKKQLQRYRDYFQKSVNKAGGIEKAFNAIEQSSYVGDINDIQRQFSIESMDNSSLKPEQIVQNYQTFFKYLKEGAKTIRESVDREYKDIISVLSQNTNIDTNKLFKLVYETDTSIKNTQEYFKEFNELFNEADITGNLSEKDFKRLASQLRDLATNEFAFAISESIKNLPTSDVKALIRNNKKAQAKEGAGDKADAITQAINDALTGNNEKEDIDISKHLGDLTGVIEDLKKIQDLLNQIADNKAISENVDRITLKLDSMQQSFRDLLRNLNDSVKSNQVNLDMGEGNIEITAAQRAEEASENIKILIDQLDKLNTEISEIRKSIGTIDSENGITSLLSQFNELSIKIDNIQNQLSNGILSTLNSQNNIEAKFGDLSSISELLRDIKVGFEDISSNKELPLLIDSVNAKLDSMKQSTRDLLRNLQDVVKSISLKETNQDNFTDQSKEQKLLALISELKDLVGNIEVMPNIPHPRDFIGKIDELLEGYFASVEIRPDFNPSNYIVEIDRLIEDETLRFSDLARYLTETIPNAIEEKNGYFRQEVSVVNDVVNQEIEAIKKLEKELRNKVPKAIDKKNEAFKEEANLVNELFNENNNSTFQNIEENAIQDVAVSDIISNKTSESSKAAEETAIASEHEADSINQVGEAAEETAKKKNKLTEANIETAKAADNTSEKAKEEANDIENIGKTANQSSATMDDAFDKIQDSIKRALGEQEEFTENNENLGKSALATAEKLEEEMDVADALFNVLTTRSKTLVDVDGEAYKLDAGKKFTAQTVAGRKVSMTAIPRKDEDGNLLGYATVIDQQTDYMKIVNQAAKAVKDLQKAEHDRAIQLQKNPNSKNIKEYDNLIAEAKQRLDAATTAARKFAEENEFFINDTKYSSKYLMGIFNRNVAQAVAADTSKENIRYNKTVESTQEQAEKQIEAVNNKLSQQEILLRSIQYSYDQSIAKGVSKPVTDEQDLTELETNRMSILEKINKLKNTNATQEELREIREEIAEYKQLAKAKKDINNPTKREMGGQKLDVAIQQELAAYDKVLDRARQYGDLTEDITTSLEEQRKILEENKNIDTLYNSQDYRKALDAQLKSFEIAEKRKKIEAQSKERGEILSNKQLIALNELIEKEQELKELGLYTDEVKEKLGKLFDLVANPGQFTGLTKFRTELQLFNQEMKTEVQNRKKELKDKEKANQPKKEFTKVTDEEKLNQVYDDLIRKYQELLSLKQKLRATSDGEDTQGLEANIKNIEKDITNLERRRHTLTDKGIDNADKLNTYLSSMKKYTTYEEQFLSAQGLVNETYTQEIENLKEIDRLRKRNVTVAGKEIGEEEVRNKELINALLEENNELEKKRNSILEDNNSDVKENVILQEQLNNKLKQSQKIEEETNLKTNEKLNNQIYNKIKSLDKLDVNKYINEARIELEALQKYIADIREKPIEFTTDEGINKLKEINNLFNNFQSHRNASEFLTANENMLRKLEQKIQSFQQKNSGMGSEFMKQFEDLKLKITPEMSKEDATKLANEFIKLQTEVTKADKLGKSFFKTIGEHLKSINAQFIAQYFSFQDLLRYARSAFEAVRQLDTALVDLKKTTTMNNTDLEGFYRNSSKIAKQTGVTTEEIITQASAWSRLGYSSKEAASSMAELSSQFAKISPGTSVEDATDYLVSTMKAFHIDVADVESEIMDTINRIGNTMATSNSEVGEMLKRSSAAMAEANNSLAETIALESAAVQITRNAETTGTAFRTISMRIRGYDEETEELSEDLQNISGDIADLTKVAGKSGGISLFTDETKTTYKSTYQLLKEISEIYHDLTDKQQAALLEKLAGKRGGQVLAGILNDFSEVERAMSEIEQSAGSADKEMGIIQESLDYKINALKETWTGIFQNLIDRGVIGDIIDILTKLSEVIEKITSNTTGVQMLFSTIIGGIVQIKTKGNFDWIEQFKNLGSSLMEFMSIRETSSAQIIEQSNAETQSINNETTALVQEEVQAAATSKAMTLLKSVTNALITSAIIFGITKLVQLFDDWVHRAERLADAAKKARDEISNINKSFTDLKNTTNEIKKRYADLSQGVANLGTAFQSQGNLSTDEYEEFLDLSNQLAELYPQLTRGYDDNKNAILDLSGSVNTIVGSLDDLIEKERILARRQINEEMPTIWEANSFSMDEYLNELDQDTKSYQEYIDALEFMRTHINDRFSLNEGASLYDNTLIELTDPNVQSALSHAFHEAGINLNELFNEVDAFGNRIGSFENLTEEQIDKIQDALAKHAENYADGIQEYEDKIKQINAEMVEHIQDYLSGDLVFLGLDENLQKTALEMFTHFDMSNLPEEGMNWEDLTDWYHKNIIKALNEVDDKDIQEKIGQLFSGDGTLLEAQSLYETIYNYLIDQKGFKATDPLMLYIQEEIRSQENDIRKAANKLINNVFGRDNRIRKRNEYETFLADQSDEFKDWVTNDLSIPYNTIYTTQELLDLYDEWLKKTKLITDATKEMRTAVNAVDTFAQTKQALSSLSEIYEQVVTNKEFANPEYINNVESAFGGIAEESPIVAQALTNFENVLLEFPGDSKKAQDAINKLVSAYIDESDILKDLTEDNKEWKIATLEAMGITNAEEVVLSRLTATTKASIKVLSDLRDELTKFKEVERQEEKNPLYDEKGFRKYSENYINALNDLKEKTKDALTVYDKEGREYYKQLQLSDTFVKTHLNDIQAMAEGDEEALERVKLAASKEVLGESLIEITPTLSTEELESQVNTLADYFQNIPDMEIGASLNEGEFINGLNNILASGKYTADQVAEFMKSMGYDVQIEQAKSKVIVPNPNGSHMTSVYGGSNAGSTVSWDMKEMEMSFPSVKIITKKGSYGGGVQADMANYKPPKENNSGGGSDKEEDKIKDQLDVLKWLYDNDVIDYKHYLDQKKVLLDRALTQGLIDEKRYFEEIHTWLRETLDLYNSVISYATKLLDKEIDRLEKERDERIKSIEEQRDAELKAIDEEIEAQEKKIKLKQTEIDELQKANEARKQAIDLQKAEYELQRSMHQRTLLQYQEGPDGKGQLVYRNDPNAIKDARDNLEEQQYQKRLTILENELELLEKSRDTLNEQREEIEKHYQELIDETNKYYDEAIKGIEEYKSKWEELAELEEQVIMQVKLESLGLSMEQILSMDEGAFEAFKQNYVGILADIYRENEHVTDALGQNVEGQLSSYMQSLQPFFDQLKQIDLTDTDTALATVTERFQTIQDCLTEIDPVDAINGFESTTRAVNSVVNAINGGGGDVSENVSSDGNLVEAFGEVATAGVEAVEGENGIVPEMQAAKKEIENATEAIIGDGGLAEQIGVISSEPYDIVFNVVVQGADQLKSITGSEATLTGFTKEGSAKFEGTVGNAFANGYPGLNSPEYSALRSEYGQPELTVYPNGTYELTTTPTLSDLPKDTVIFNEEQTKRILKNSVAKNFKGKAFANGTPYLPLQDVMPDKAAIFDKFEANITDNLSKMKNDISEMTSNVREITRTITNNQINNNSGSTVNVGDINVTCPGVTEAEVARNLGAAIRSELNGVVSGMALRANQLAMRR